MIRKFRENFKLNLGFNRSIYFITLIFTFVVFSGTCSAANKASPEFIKKSYEKLLQAIVKRDYDYVRNNLEEYEMKFQECNGKNSLDKKVCIDSLNKYFGNEALENSRIFKWLPRGSSFKMLQNDGDYLKIEVTYKDINSSPKIRGKSIKNGIFYTNYSCSDYFKKPFHINITYKHKSFNVNDFNEIDDGEYRALKGFTFWPEPIDVLDFSESYENKEYIIKFSSKRLVNFSVLINNEKYYSADKILNYFDNYRRNNWTDVEKFKRLFLNYNVEHKDEKYFYRLSLKSDAGGEFEWPDDLKFPLEFIIFMYDDSTPPQEKMLKFVAIDKKNQV